MKIRRLQCQWDNVRFVPARERTWYRAYDKQTRRYLGSDLKVGNLQINVAYFTSDGDIDGYMSRIYIDGKMTDWLDLKDGNYIRAKNIASAEKQALAWAEDLYGEPGL